MKYQCLVQGADFEISRMEVEAENFQEALVIADQQAEIKFGPGVSVIVFDPTQLPGVFLFVSSEGSSDNLEVLGWQEGQNVHDAWTKFRKENNSVKLVEDELNVSAFELASDMQIFF